MERQTRTYQQLAEAAKKLFDAIGQQDPPHNIKWEIGLAVSQWLEDYDKMQEAIKNLKDVDLPFVADGGDW